MKQLKLPKVQSRYNRKEKGPKNNQNSLRCYKIFESWLTICAFQKSLKESNSLGFFSFLFFYIASYPWSIYLLKCLSWCIVTKITWQLVWSWTWVLIILIYWFASCDCELSCQTILQLWDWVFTSRWEVNTFSSITSWARNFTCKSWRSSMCLTKVSDTASFIFW